MTQTLDPKAAVTMALDGLPPVTTENLHYFGNSAPAPFDAVNIRAMARELLAHRKLAALPTEAPEPVAWLVRFDLAHDDEWAVTMARPPDGNVESGYAKPLYTSSPQGEATGLTSSPQLAPTEHQRKGDVAAAASPDPVSEAAYYASVWKLSDKQMRDLESSFRSFARPATVSSAVPVAWACTKCNSPRSVDPCPKCGTPLVKPADGWEWPTLPDIDRIRALAKEVGYAVGVHGSLERDLDLIAAPWVAEAVGPLALAEHIAAGLGGRVVDFERQDKPCGRWSCNIHTPDWTKMIDLSVMPATVFDAAKALIASRTDTYRAGNNRQVGIQDQSGEKMWIVPFDEMADLERAIAGSRANG